MDSASSVKGISASHATVWQQGRNEEQKPCIILMIQMPLPAVSPPLFYLSSTKGKRQRRACLIQPWTTSQNWASSSIVSPRLKKGSHQLHKKNVS